ncbi:tetratricopeptide repeat protein [Polynucleobacter sp. AP-Titi-500A-B4]|uniref:tetratricopeptide repeat protein n=1 Tax=Polynucleobacter sp. AP-Titi-500A-B4 TaxID=2576923 RepID=UPI001BFE3840|nr:tetratricopeptide repeat protein [Polynucleobacter sp. AP-Titi-500A-B4]QWE12488.1 sel1 repeat family protein [Polynucleobacter sp. AP-Titi-500A-B4]
MKSFIKQCIAFFLMFNLSIALSQTNSPALQSQIDKANTGDAGAMNMVGNFYANGSGVDKNLYEAKKWYEAAAKKGYAAGYFNLGLMYERGEIVPKDINKAMELYKTAANGGLPAAQKKLDALASQSSAPVAIPNQPVQPQSPVPAVQTPTPTAQGAKPANNQLNKAQVIELAANEIGGPEGWGKCMVAHTVLDLSATNSPLPPKLAKQNQGIGVLLGEIRQYYLRSGFTDAYLGQFIKAYRPTINTGDQALDALIPCNNKLNSATALWNGK